MLSSNIYLKRLQEKNNYNSNAIFEICQKMPGSERVKEGKIKSVRISYFRKCFRITDTSWSLINEWEISCFWNILYFLWYVSTFQIPRLRINENASELCLSSNSYVSILYRTWNEVPNTVRLQEKNGLIFFCFFEMIKRAI